MNDWLKQRINRLNESKMSNFNRWKRDMQRKLETLKDRGVDVSEQEAAVNSVNINSRKDAVDVITSAINNFFDRHSESQQQDQGQDEEQNQGQDQNDTSLEIDKKEVIEKIKVCIHDLSLYLSMGDEGNAQKIEKCFVEYLSPIINENNLRINESLFSNILGGDISSLFSALTSVFSGGSLIAKSIFSTGGDIFKTANDTWGKKPTNKLEQQEQNLRKNINGVKRQIMLLESLIFSLHEDKDQIEKTWKAFKRGPYQRFLTEMEQAVEQYQEIIDLIKSGKEKEARKIIKDLLNKTSSQQSQQPKTTTQNNNQSNEDTI